MHTIYSEKHKLRNATAELHGGELVTPFECPERAIFVLNAIQSSGLGDVLEPQEFGLEPVLAVHDAGYLKFLEVCHSEWLKLGHKGEAVPNCWPSRSMNSPHIPEHIEGQMGHYALAGETSITEGTWEAVLAAKDVALTATQSVISQGERAAFALCRPPGHHAAFDQYGGYCFLNNAAIAAQYALDQGAKRVAILDVDFHHGNGTQQIFYDRDDVYFLSLHGDPKVSFPYYLGHADETGEGKGVGFNQNYPLAALTEYAVWKQALENALTKITAYQPDVLIVSLGVDTFENDPISSFKVKSAGFTDYGRCIGQCGLPTVFVMEGGYAVAEVGINVVNVLKGFESESPEV